MAIVSPGFAGISRLVNAILRHLSNRGVILGNSMFGAVRAGRRRGGSCENDRTNPPRGAQGLTQTCF